MTHEYEVSTVAKAKGRMAAICAAVAPADAKEATE